MIYLPPDAKAALGDAYDQRFRKPKKGIPLPCSDSHPYGERAYAEIASTGDQVVVCPLCGKRHYLVWSALQDHLRWRK
jgi:hypothetical protein